MSIPAFVNAGTVSHGSGAGPTTPTLPASRSNGNLLIAMIVEDSAGATRTFSVSGTGWHGPFANQTTTGVNSALFYCIVDGTETDPTISFSGSCEFSAQIFQYSGVVSGFVPSNFSSHTQNGTSITGTSITTTAANSLVVSLVGGDTDLFSVSTPSGWTLDFTGGSHDATISAFSQGKGTSGTASDAFASTVGNGGANPGWVTWEIEVNSVNPAVTITSTMDQTLSAITQAAAVAESMPSAIAQTLPGFVQEDDITVVNSSIQIDQTLSGIVQEADVHVSPVGTWASTETKDHFAAAGVVPIAAPVFVDAGTVAHVSNNTTITPTLPASLVNGNILVAMVAVSANRTFTFPAGWTPIDHFNDGNVSAAYAYRVVDGSETDPAITWTTNTDAAAKIWQFSGAVFIGPNLAKVGDPGNTATLTNPGIATTADNSLVVLLAFGNNGTISGTPTSYTSFSNENPIGFALGAFGEDVSILGHTSDTVSEGLSGAMRWISFEFELCNVIPPNFAAWASTEAKDVFAAAGGLLGGSWHSTEAPDTMAQPFGTWASTEAPDHFSGAGSPTPPLGLDVQAVGGAHGSSGSPITSATVALTTTFADDVIVVGIYSGGFWHQGAVTSITDTAGLTWKKRASRQVVTNHLNGTQDSFLETWWAHKPTAGATTITVNTDPTGAIALDAWAIKGANYLTPFDTNTGSGLIVDNYNGNIIDPNGRGHFGNPAALVYSDASHFFSLAFHASPDQQCDTTVAPAYTFVSRTEQDEGAGNTLFLASCASRIIAQQFGTLDCWFGPDATHISNRAIILDNIVAIDQSGTNDVIRWYFDGNGNRTIVQLGVGENSTSMNFTTFRDDDVCAVAVMIQSSLGARVDHISDSANHSGWTRRSIVIDPSGAISMELWWVKMGDILDGQVTITLDGQASAGDVISAICFAINGADTFQRGEIWDQNGSLPATGHGTVGVQTVGPFSSSNDNVLVIAIGGNITVDDSGDLTGLNQLPYLFLPAPAELESDGPPSYHLALQYKFSAGVVNNATAAFDVSPAPPEWLMIADVMPVGPVSPPHGSLIVTEPRDHTSNNGTFEPLYDANGWVGFVPAHATMAPTEHPDKTTNSGAFTALFDINGWVGFIPAFMSWTDTEARDTTHQEGWVLGPTTILGRMAAGEAPDRFAASNIAAVTGQMHPTESKDRWAGNALVIPKAHPQPARKRRLMIVT